MTTMAVARKLGGRKVLRREITSELELAQAVREGLPSSALDFVLARLGQRLDSQVDVFGVVGNARTLRRKRAEGTRLSARESDRLARLARVMVRAEESLGDEERATRWLARRNRALGGNRPLTLLDSDAGARAVAQMLGRIEHGVHS
jgi:putative toxin-antitoxin system antitoxin component (TIGR02293 family)